MHVTLLYKCIVLYTCIPFTQMYNFTYMYMNQFYINVHVDIIQMFKSLIQISVSLRLLAHILVMCFCLNKIVMKARRNVDGRWSMTTVTGEAVSLHRCQVLLTVDVLTFVRFSDYKLKVGLGLDRNNASRTSKIENVYIDCIERESSDKTLYKTKPLKTPPSTFASARHMASVLAAVQLPVIVANV